MIVSVLIEGLLETGDAPFQPNPERTSRQQVKVAEDGRAGILVVDELVQKEVDHDAERIQCKIPNVFCEDEDCEGDGEGDVREGRLQIENKRRCQSRRKYSMRRRSEGWEGSSRRSRCPART